jgi:hypothetical protein
MNASWILLSSHITFLTRLGAVKTRSSVWLIPYLSTHKYQMSLRLSLAGDNMLHFGQYMCEALVDNQAPACGQSRQTMCTGN